jgi:predicted protein tyrosine phosphatase
MPVTVTSIYGVHSLFNEANIVVSILNPNKDHEVRDFLKKVPQAPREKHFKAFFEDTEHPSELEWMKMSREVKSILYWVKRNATLDSDIVVHCHAGVSRSPAVAWLILVMFGMDAREAFDQLFKANRNIWPNTQVLAIGAEFLKLDPSFMQLVQQVETEIAMQKREYLGYGG